MVKKFVMVTQRNLHIAVALLVLSTAYFFLVA